VSPELQSQLNAHLVADGSDRMEWLRARATGITATDAAQLSSPRAIDRLARQKAYGTHFSGSKFTEYGKHREPALAEWMRQRCGVLPSRGLYSSMSNPRHLATPDGVGTSPDGTELLLGEIKTSTKPLTTIPATYRRQIYWQQYVMGARRTALIWEQHQNFVPLGDPLIVWVDRDDREIERLIDLADQTLHVLSTVYS